MQFYDHEHVVECIQWAPDKALHYIAEAEKDRFCKLMLFSVFFTVVHVFVNFKFLNFN